jgi:hypothetical protein
MLICDTSHFNSNNFSEFDPALVGATCVFLASKVEECPLRPDAVAQEMKAMSTCTKNTKAMGS